MRKKPLNSRIAILAAAVLALAPMAMLTGCGSSDDPVPTYSVGATVSGLPANYSVVLQNNGGDDLTVTADGTNNFSKAAANGASYHVTVKTQPNSAANTLCVASNPAGTVSGGAVTVTVQCVPTVTVSGHVEDGSTNTYLAATIEARNPADDSVIATTTCDSSATGTNYSIQAPNGLDFYLHANGGDIGGTTYVADNLQIQNETTASAVVFYMVDTANINTIAGAMGFDPATAAVFDGDVEDSSSTGIAGVTVTPSPTVTELLYQQTDGSFKPTGPTTTASGSSFIGWVNGLSGAATYTFTLDPDKTTKGYTIPTTFKLRLHPGEISDVVPVSYPTYSVGATVSGLPTNYSVVLQNNGGDDLTVTADGTNNFSKAAANGASYHVTVKAQPNSAANTLCVASNPAGTVSGGAVTVTVQCVPTVTVSGHVEDGSTDTYLAATIETRNPADDSVLATATCDSSTSGTNYNIQAPRGVDFYLHANGGDIGGTTYVADNLQIQNETTASAVVFYMVDTANVNTVAGAMGFDPATAAVFSGDVEDSSSTGIAGVNIDTIPAVTKLLYNKDGSNFDDTPPQTTTYNGSSFIGWVNGLSGAATYTFTLDPAQTSGGSYDYTIPTTFKLRLHPGEISDVSAVSYP